MPLADLKHLSVHDPDKYKKLVESLAERHCASFRIEGLTVSKGEMMAAFYKAFADLGIPAAV